MQMLQNAVLEDKAVGWLLCNKQHNYSSIGDSVGVNPFGAIGKMKIINSFLASSADDLCKELGQNVGLDLDPNHFTL